MKTWLHHKKTARFAILIFAFLLVASAGHWFMIQAWLDGKYMAGPGDGLSQMLPFKKMLYDMYANGEFFYTEGFGLGGGIYSQLGYYFATSLVFWLQCGITYILHFLGFIPTPDFFYWANLILIVSILRLTGILALCFLYFRYMRLSTIASFTGAVIYGTSVIYFRHVMYWEFFADAMLWLPLLLLGAEKIIREKRPGLFTIMVAVSLFDNFYFAYVNLLLTGIYILLRWLIPFAVTETKRLEQVRMYAVGGFLGLGISSVSFIPAVYGFLHNDRPPYKDMIAWFEMPENLLLTGKIMIFPAFAVFCIFLFSFYKHRLFRFYAVLVVLGILMHFSPKVASLFNGLSAPQYRWEYFLGICAGGLAAATLDRLSKLWWQSTAIAFAGMALLYFVFYEADEKLGAHGFENWQQMYMVIALAAACIAILLYLLFKKQPLASVVLSGMIVLVALFTANGFQSQMLAGEDAAKLPTRDFIQGPKYNGKEQQQLVEAIQKAEPDPHARIDWMLPFRNNTPIVQQFLGTSVYSSILNKYLLGFYLHDLKIDMGRESVSRYATLGKRANLHALFEGKYVIVKKGAETTVPFGFVPFKKMGRYQAYRNQYTLPFIRTASQVYTESSLANKSVLDREHAMLSGVVLPDKTGKGKITSPPHAVRIERERLKIRLKSATYVDDRLHVKGKTGGLDITVPQTQKDTKDFYVAFYLKRIVDTSPKEYKVKVNDYETWRKANGSIYRTNVNDLVIRIPKSKKISIRLPKGKYTLRKLAVQEENYALLQKVAKEPKQAAKLDWNGGSVLKAQVNNKKLDRFMILPIPFEKGWHAQVNGKPTDVLQANYAFSAVALAGGKNEIKLVYRPPYFYPTLMLSLASLLLTVWLLKRKKMRKTV